MGGVVDSEEFVEELGFLEGDFGEYVQELVELFGLAAGRLLGPETVLEEFGQDGGVERVPVEDRPVEALLLCLKDALHRRVLEFGKGEVLQVLHTLLGEEGG